MMAQVKLFVLLSLLLRFSFLMGVAKIKVETEQTRALRNLLLAKLLVQRTSGVEHMS